MLARTKATIINIMQTDQTYKVEYDIFMKEYKKGVTDGESVGRMIARMVQFFAEINNKLCGAETAYAELLDKINCSTDDNNKPIAANKAEIKANALDEGRKLRELKTDLKNVDQMINGLKSLQKGAMNEYAHMGL